MSSVPTIVDAFLARARDTPGVLAYTADGEATTYGALLDDARQLARGLAGLGVARGERCAAVLPTGLDFVRVVYATQLLAAAPVSVNPELPDEAIARRLQLLRPRLAFCGEALAARLAARTLPDGCRLVTVRDAAMTPGPPPRRGAPDPLDAAFLQLTSGSTGEPRAAVITHASLVASLVATAVRLDWQPGDVLASWVPLHHDLGLVRFVFGPMLSGHPSHVIKPSMVNLRAWLELLTRVGATVTGGPDSAYRLAARTVDPARAPVIDLRRLRFAGNGGEVVRTSSIEAFERRFGLTNVVRPAYGLAEATLVVTSTAPGEPLRVDADGTVSCGRPLDGLDLLVGDPDGRRVPPGETGEVLVRGTPVFAGYFDDDEATRQAFKDGWLRTGDVGSVDADGYLFVKGRSRALIKRGGTAIAPREVEDAVNRIPGVTGSAAVGVVLSALAHTEEVVVMAEVDETAPGASQDPDLLRARIDAEVRNAIGVPPGRIVLVPAGTIPRTGSGKVHYERVRAMITQG